MQKQWLCFWYASLYLLLSQSPCKRPLWTFQVNTKISRHSFGERFNFCKKTSIFRMWYYVYRQGDVLVSTGLLKSEKHVVWNCVKFQPKYKRWSRISSRSLIMAVVTLLALTPLDVGFVYVRNLTWKSLTLWMYYQDTRVVARVHPITQQWEI